MSDPSLGGLHKTTAFGLTDRTTYRALAGPYDALRMADGTLAGSTGALTASRGAGAALTSYILMARKKLIIFGLISLNAMIATNV